MGRSRENAGFVCAHCGVRVVSLTNRGYNYRGGLAELSRPQPPASLRD